MSLFGGGLRDSWREPLCANSPIGLRPRSCWVMRPRAQLSDYLVARVGGVASGSGTIAVTGVNGPVIAAIVYRHGIGRKPNPRDTSIVYNNPNISVNEVPITGVPLGDLTTNGWRDGSCRLDEGDATAGIPGNTYSVLDSSQCPNTSANGVSLVVIFDAGGDTNLHHRLIYEQKCI